MQSCLCCLRGGPDKDLRMPYIHLGKTEIYSDMLTECFDVQLTLDHDGSNGICLTCVGRLRDASDFKLQVQRSQAELRTRLGSHVKEDPEMKSGMDEDDDGTGVDHGMFEPEISLKEEGAWDESCEAGMYADQQYQLALDPETGQEVESPTELEPAPEPEFVTIEDIAPSNTRATPQQQRPASHAQATRDYNSDCNPYECGVCAEKFQQLTLLSQHVSSAHRKKPTVKKSLPKPRTRKNKFIYIEVPKSKSPEPKKETNKYICDTCGKSFSSRSGLSLHMRTHEGEKLFSCDICKKGFNILSNLETHKRTHTVEKPFTCSVCDKQFAHLRLMLKHKHMHKGEKPHSCSICKMKFRRSQSLKDHERVHTSEKAHQCDICRKKFSSTAALRCHRRLHSGETPYDCDTCDEQFSSSLNLRRHKRRRDCAKNS